MFFCFGICCFYLIFLSKVYHTVFSSFVTHVGEINILQYYWAFIISPFIWVIQGYNHVLMCENSKINSFVERAQVFILLRSLLIMVQKFPCNSDFVFIILDSRAFQLACFSYVVLLKKINLYFVNYLGLWSSQKTC